MDAPLLLRAQAAAARAVLGLPPMALVRIAGGRCLAKDGCVLDAQTQMLVWLAAKTGRAGRGSRPLAQERREFDREAPAFFRRHSPLTSIHDQGLDANVRARVYKPYGARPRGPAVVFFHGGGFVIGGLTSHDPICRALAHDTGFVVVAIDYRLAPEHPFPAPADDATAAFRWVVREAEALGVDPERVAVAGDSAGGNLSAVVCLDTRGDAVKPRFQALVYPATDSTWSFPSIDSMATGGLLTREEVGWFRSQHTPDPATWTHPRASPWFADDVRGLPPALVQTAGFDPLRDEGEAYGEKLRAAGVPVTVKRYPTLSHGYLNVVGSVTAAAEPWDDLVEALRQHLR